LGRFYLNHRFSDDLDFFVNHNSTFGAEVKRIYKYLIGEMSVDTASTIDTPEFVRIWIDGEPRMKLEFVNDVAEYCGAVMFYQGIPIDNPQNILANKLGAMLSRDEAKDVFDIVSLADHYSFDWKTMYGLATQKQLMNEQDILMRITTFPVDWLPEQKWLHHPVDLSSFKEKLDRIADDFILGRDNSLGDGKTPIDQAQPGM